MEKGTRIAILYGGNSLAPNGAALYVNRFYNNLELYFNNGIEVLICDSVHEFTDAQAYMLSKKFVIRQKIKKLLKKTMLGNYLYMNIFLQHGRQCILLNRENIKRASILLANDFWSAYYATKFYPSKPLIFVMHNSGDLFSMLFSELPFLKKGITYFFLKKNFDKILASSKKIVFVSETARRFFVSQYSGMDKKTIFIPQCIEDSVYLLNKDFTKLNFICIGTVCHRKNQFSILQALYLLLQKRILKNDDFTIAFVGDGSELQHCKEFVQEKELKGVTFYGTQSDVVYYLNQSNCFILASHDEGLPTVAIEALRAGLPLVLSNVGGCGELIKGNGILIKDGSVEEIMCGIQYMFENRTKMFDMAKKSRLIYQETYTIDIMIDRYSKLINQVIDE